MIDELDSIGAINSLKDAVTRLRKSGIAVVCAIQDYGQLVERYGAQTASTLFGCFSNRAVPAVQQQRPGREGVEGNRPGRDGGNSGPGPARAPTMPGRGPRRASTPPR